MMSPIQRVVSDSFKEIDYAITDKDREQWVKDRLTVVDVSELKDGYVHLEVKKQKRLLSIEESDQGVLFSAELMGKIVPFTAEGGAPATVKYEFAVGLVHEQRRLKQLEDLQRKQRAFEINEERYNLFMPILRQNPDMTTGDALRSLGMYPEKEGLELAA